MMDSGNGNSQQDQDSEIEGQEHNDEGPLVVVKEEIKLSDKIELNAHFPSFIALRSSLDKYQKKHHVQLVVKDSKLLSAESTRRVIPKVYHLVNQSLMYHSITYFCKCHGSLKQKPGSRIKNIGAKRLNCPMYLRFKLSTDLQSLVLFDLYETHNHPTDPNTFQLSPRQQVYRLSLIQRGEADPEDEKQAETISQSSGVDVKNLIATAIKDVNSVSSLKEDDLEPPSKMACIAGNSQTNEPSSTDQARNNDDTEKGTDDEEEVDEDDHVDDIIDDNSPLDPESSCSDTEEEDFQKQLPFLPYPIRLIGSAVRASPELQALTKELIESQKENLLVARKKLLLQTRLLELKNAKLALEVKNMEKNLASSSDQATTFYLQS